MQLRTRVNRETRLIHIRFDHVQTQRDYRALHQFETFFAGEWARCQARDVYLLPVHLADDLTTWIENNAASFLAEVKDWHRINPEGL